MLPLTLSLPAVPLLILFNAFFVAAEYALVAIRDVQIELLRNRGWHRSATAITALRSRPADAIGAIQVCITMTNLLLGWIGEPAMSQVLHAALGPLSRVLPDYFFSTLATLLSFLVVTLLTVVFSELLPKALTLRSVTPVVILTSVPMIAIRGAVAPLLWVMNGLANMVTRPLGLGRVEDMVQEATTAQDIVHLTTKAAQEGALPPQVRDVVMNTLSLGRRTAGQIRVPRNQVAYLDMRWSMEKNRSVIDSHLFSRLPLCNGGLDNVIGVIRTKDFLTAYDSGGDVTVLPLIAQQAVFLPQSLPVHRLLTSFREHDTQMLFLVDERGGTDGIVTLRDIVGELLGPDRPGPSNG